MHDRHVITAKYNKNYHIADKKLARDLNWNKTHKQYVTATTILLVDWLIDLPSSSPNEIGVNGFAYLIRLCGKR